MSRDSCISCLCVTAVKRRPTTSLANYDIEMLAAWYTAVREAHGKNT
jgi:origin recognition complex subunit 3